MKLSLERILGAAAGSALMISSIAVGIALFYQSPHATGRPDEFIYAPIQVLLVYEGLSMIEHANK